MYHWMVDESINISAICRDAGWHLASVIQALIDEGLNRTDAESFAQFVFADAALASSIAPEECVTDDQYQRLTVTI